MQYAVGSMLTAHYMHTIGDQAAPGFNLPEILSEWNGGGTALREGHHFGVST